MSDYIDRETVYKALCEFCAVCPPDKRQPRGCEINATFRGKMKRAKNVVEVVRCKDCENYAGEGMYCAWNVLTGDMGYCHHALPIDRKGDNICREEG